MITPLAFSNPAGLAQATDAEILASNRTPVQFISPVLRDGLRSELRRRLDEKDVSAGIKERHNLKSTVGVVGS